MLPKDKKYDTIYEKDVLGCDYMRFIGSKVNLLANIESVINQNVQERGGVFCDIFSGTGSVARHFKPYYEIHSNDALYFSYVIQKATIENNSEPSFEKLKDIGILDPISFLEDTKIRTYNYNDDKYFIAKNYTPHDNCSRMYFSNKNAVRIDFIRNTIEAWKKTGLLNELEYFYLLAALIEGVPSVSNTTGTYGAYLKQWDKRSFKELELFRLDVIDNGRNNKCYNDDALKLIDSLEGNIIYIDPPYNERQYASNYHILETISKYDYPEIRGITGLRPYKEQKSPFCIKAQVNEAFEYLISKTKFENIVMSYSNDGIMSENVIETVLKKFGLPETYKRYTIPYRQYKSKKDNKQHTLCEYLFYIKKHIEHINYFYFDFKENDKSTTSRIIAENKKYIKSPTNYIGGKYKVLPQIMPNFPSDIHTFVDLFSGGCNVAINIWADKVYCNDLNSIIIELFEYFKSHSVEKILSEVYTVIDKYQLSKTNEEGFISLRKAYNSNPNPIDLYVLSCYSFNYQFRFNSNHEYNNPFGKNRSQFSETMKNNLIKFVNKLHEIDISFSSVDFLNFDISLLNSGDLIYCDPPYLITTGSYNDGNRGFKDWGIKEEKALYDFLDKADSQGIRFALSNVFEHKGKTNDVLKEWAKKYRVIDIDRDYSNSSYNTSQGTSREVLIVNY